VISSSSSTTSAISERVSKTPPPCERPATTMNGATIQNSFGGKTSSKAVVIAV